MNIEEAVKRLKEIQKDDDTEQAHVDADNVLLELIDNEEVTEAYMDIEMWYS